MKKLLTILAMAAALAGCNKDSIKGKEYKLTNSPNNAEISLAFGADDNRYFGAVVNRYFGTYELNGTKIKFGPAASTMMMGPEDQMVAENEYLKILPTMSKIKLDGKKLTLSNDKNEELFFEEVGVIKEAQ